MCLGDGRPVDEGDKVRWEFTECLQAQQIRHIKKLGLWPPEFEEREAAAAAAAEAEAAAAAPEVGDGSSTSSDEDGRPALVPNSNRRVFAQDWSSDSDSSGEEGGGSDGGGEDG